jgi:hypothetical protein
LRLICALFVHSASRDGEVIFKQDVAEVDGVEIDFVIAEIRERNLHGYRSTSYEDTGLNLTFRCGLLGLFNVPIEKLLFEFEVEVTVPNYTAPASLHLLRLFIGGPLTADAFTREYPGEECDETVRILAEGTFLTYVMCIDDEHILQNDSFGGVLMQFKELQYYPLGSPYLRAFYTYPDLPDDIRVESTNSCELPFCAPTYSVTLLKMKNGTISPSYQATSLQSSLHSLTSSVIPFVPHGIAGLGTFSFVNGNSLKTELFIETDRYTTTDTAIDSFAISGLIMSALLLFVMLTKMAVWFFFNPSG